MLREIQASIKMRLYRMGMKRVLLYLSIPVFFILTVIMLTFHLLGEPQGADSREGRPKLIANRNGNRDLANFDDGMDLKFESSYNKDPLEKTYDVDKLLMLGMVKTEADEQKKEEGIL